VAEDDKIDVEDELRRVREEVERKQREQERLERERARARGARTYPSRTRGPSIAEAEPLAGAKAYAAFIAEQVDRQEARKSSLESRGVTVITTSGTLATLLLGLTAIATKAQDTFMLPDEARPPLALALIAFVLAAVAAIFTNAPRNYKEATVESLRKLVETSWDDTERVALQEVAKAQLRVLERAKEMNGQKARALVAGVMFETAAVAALAWAMIVLLY
jgi:hypothetical protein